MLDHLLDDIERGVRRTRPAQQRSHPGTELADRERLRDVVVGAELEADHLVELVVAGGQHDDRDGARRPQALADLEPVEPRQHDVEHDEVDRLLRELLQRLFAVGRLDHLVAVALEREGRAPCARRPRRRPAGSWGRGRPSRRWPTVALGMSASPVSARGGGARRRKRRGSLERPVNARLYRSSFLLLSLPLLILAFSITRPGPLPAPLLPPNFDGAAALRSGERLLEAVPGPRARGAGLAAGRAVVPRPDEALPARLLGRLAGARARARQRRAARTCGRSSADSPRMRSSSWRTGTTPASGRVRTTTRAAPLRSSSSRAATRRPTLPRRERVRPAHTLVFLSTTAARSARSAPSASPSSCRSVSSPSSTCARSPAPGRRGS